MKKVLLFAAMLAVAASCTVQEIDSIKGTTAPEITASYENNGTKTTITTDEEGVGTIWWKPADEINVFYGNLSTHYVSKNTENATTVAFGTTDIIGSTESASENIWGLYPYNENAVCDGESVTTTIPAAQQAIAGSFDDDIFTSLAHSTSTVMTFYNVLGGIKFSLSRDDIKKITFKGNNSEDIAGKVKLKMDANGKPVAEVIEGEKTITLTPKEGTTFAKNTNYYLVMLPTVLSKGFTMTFETETAIGTFEYTTKSIEIKRSVFSKKENIDTYATFKAIPPTGAVDLGLSVMWATCNINASNPEEYGDYYAWGEIEAKDAFYKDGYKWYRGVGFDSHIMTKYNTESYKDITQADNKTVLDMEDDIAYLTLGEGWRIPQRDEWIELVYCCDWTWTEQNGVNGYEVKSKSNSNSIFLPAGGYRYQTYLNNVGSQGKYWSANKYYFNSQGSYPDDEAYCASFDVKDKHYASIAERYLGLTVRPIYGSPSLITVESLSLNQTLINIGPGDTFQLIATILPDNAIIKDITWHSSNDNIASVNNMGLVQGLDDGTCTITVESVSGEKKATCEVTVTSPKYIENGYDCGKGIAIKQHVGNVEKIVVWAPKNLGYRSKDSWTYPYGLLYQWGRLAGVGYGSKTETTSSGDYRTFKDENGQTVHVKYHQVGPISSPDPNTIYFGTYRNYWDSYEECYYESENDDWYDDYSHSIRKNWNDITNDGYIGNPCPPGWRIPTRDELAGLIENKSSFDTWESGQKGYRFYGSQTYTNRSVFLPASGYNRFDNPAQYRNEIGRYWASEGGEEGIELSESWMYRWVGYYMELSASGASLTHNPYQEDNYGYRYNTYSIRCVKE